MHSHLHDFIQAFGKMYIIWIALPLAVFNISYGYKLPRAELKANNTNEKDHLLREDPLISSSLVTNLFQWLSEPTSGDPTVLNLIPSKVLRVKRDNSLEELTTAEDLIEELTTEAVTQKAVVTTGNLLTVSEPTQHPDMSTIQTELIEVTTPQIVTIHDDSSSDTHDMTTSSKMVISESVTETVLIQTSVPALVTDPVLTSATYTKNSTTMSFTSLIDSGIGPSTIRTSGPAETMKTTSVNNFSHTDISESTHVPQNPDITNQDDAQSEKQNIMHTLMGQCLLAISILALIATIFIISTIVLAAKLANLKNRYKLLNKNSTEMVCISSLLPDSDQVAGKSKVKANKLKTFAANVEDSDGDNLTLNSFLPDH